MKSFLSGSSRSAGSSSTATKDSVVVAPPAAASAGGAAGGGASSNGLSARMARNLLGQLLRSTAPPWIAALEEDRTLRGEETKRKAAASECALCTMPLGRSKKEASSKRMCKVCGAVCCRLCTATIHLAGKMRRKYVCLRCVSRKMSAFFPSDTAPGRLAPLPKAATTPRSSSSGGPSSEAAASASSANPIDVPLENDMMTRFVGRLWDGLFSAWGDGADDSGLEGEEGEGDEDEDAGASIPPTIDLGAPVAPVAKLEGVLGGEGKFDGDELRRLLLESRVGPEQHMCVPFLNGCYEVVKLMNGLGRAFEFAGNDMNLKISLVEQRCGDTAKEFGKPPSEISLEAMVEREIKAGTTHAGKKAAPAARTILRLLWFLDFIGVLLAKLVNEPKLDLRTTLTQVYDETLGPRHVWVLRRVVRSGMSLVQDKKHFIPKLGLDKVGGEKEQAEKMTYWAVAVDQVRGELWAYMKSKGLEELV